MSGVSKYIVLCGYILLFSRTYTSDDNTNITVAILIERSAIQDMPFIINRTIGIIEIGTKVAQEMTQNVTNLNFILRYADVPGCVNLKWGALASELYHNYDLQAIIGPSCSRAVETVARLTAAWNLPHITPVGTGEALGNKTEFSTLTRLSFNLNLYAKFYMEVFKAFNWVDIANIYENDEFLPGLVGKSLQRSFEEHGVKSTLFGFKAKSDDLKSELLKVLYKAKRVSRVFVVCCTGDVFRHMVLLAQEVGMRPEEYTFIFYISQPGAPVIGDFSWERGDELDSAVRKAYESVLVVSPRRPTTNEFLEFEKEVIRRALSVYNYTWSEKEEVGIYNIGLYDSFVLYALGLLDSLEAGQNIRDGRVMNQRFWNRTFSGIGGKVYVNENGDRNTDFTLLDMDPVSGKFRAVAQFLGYTQTFEMLTNVPVHWPNNAGPPKSTPDCGFVDELCSIYSFPLYGIVIIAFAAVIILILLFGTLAFRRIRLEAAIQSQWWKVRWQEVQCQNRPIRSSTGSKLEEIESLATPAAAAQNTGVYKGVPVHIRKLNVKYLTVDRKLQLELKQTLTSKMLEAGIKMRDVTCQNLTRLIGVCPNPNNICILTELCSRGNLQDMLHNESIQLDKDFRLSLINDIAQGMYYIHNSPIEVHGCLRSSTCVIDSRFVLKITGFGLRSINDSVDDSSSAENRLNLDRTEKEGNKEKVARRRVARQFHDVHRVSSLEMKCSDVLIGVHELLWLAPEILRNYPKKEISKPGDVYSFAIILYEMCTRQEPYVTESWYQSLEETIEQIKTNRPKPRRPSFGNNTAFPEIYKLAHQCWKEKPEERPTFYEIRKDVQYIRRGNPHGKNVFDMLLHRMEKYANTLESLVEERTNAYLEEKKRSEELLYQILPKSVAVQLRSGLTVTPEAFESVTVYFSDIVGFTTISAASTPFQVVDLLNDIYTCFDEIIDNFEVYKVETIGDAYMVVSGLPVRNGHEHVRQIARMSLKILEQVAQFSIRHQPHTALQARIGIHSGSVVAGVVGCKMPRYCLFGDTVIVASRMESIGEPMMIHISDSTRQLLEEFGTFVIETRGLIHIQKMVMGRSRQATIRPLRATLTDAYRKTQQLQTSEQMCCTDVLAASGTTHRVPTNLMLKIFVTCLITSHS